LLTSLQNNQVKQVVSLHRRKGRDESKKFLVEGWRFVEEAVQRGAEIEQVFVCPTRIPPEWQFLIDEIYVQRLAVEEVDERLLRRMGTTEEPQGILAVARQKTVSWGDLSVDAQSLLLIIDGVQDPGNLGTILRTALASGITQVCLTSGTVDLYNPKVLRSTMGTIFSLRVVNEVSTDEIINFCQANSLTMVTADLKGEPLYSAKIEQVPMALIVGNEGKGPADQFKTAADQTVTIPMYNQVESLNVGIATGILLYEIVRRRDFL